LLLISAPAFTDATAQHANVIEAAKRCGVRHLIYAATQRVEGVDFEIPQVTEWDKETEGLLEKSRLEVTILRNSMYLDMLPIGFGKNVTEVGVRVPAGNGVAALASRHDLAEGAAAVLSSDGHEGSATVGLPACRISQQRSPRRSVGRSTTVTYLWPNS
jgi:NAD(P)H dehydrogenase (quinone)